VIGRYDGNCDYYYPDAERGEVMRVTVYREKNEKRWRTDNKRKTDKQDPTDKGIKTEKTARSTSTAWNKRSLKTLLHDWTHPWERHVSLPDFATIYWDERWGRHWNRLYQWTALMGRRLIPPN
jgi:hypothetical protein